MNNPIIWVGRSHSQINVWFYGPVFIYISPNKHSLFRVESNINKYKPSIPLEIRPFFKAIPHQIYIYTHIVLHWFIKISKEEEDDKQ